jgi:hypothetical protein
MNRDLRVFCIFRGAVGVKKGENKDGVGESYWGFTLFINNFYSNDYSIRLLLRRFGGRAGDGETEKGFRGNGKA